MHIGMVCPYSLTVPGGVQGQVLGLARALRSRGVTVHHSFDPGIVPDALRVIPGTEHVIPLGEVPLHRGLVVTLDCASADRAGDWTPLADAATEVLVVDHHGSNPGFGSHLLLDPGAASTASLVLDILDAGLVPDTGSFRWGGPGSHDTARRLLAAGAESIDLGFALLDAHPFSWLPVLGGLLASVRLEASAVGGRGAVWLHGPHAVIATAEEADVESIVSHLQGVREAHVAVLLKEFRPGEWAVSLRSRGGAVDVSAVAAALGGGGHPAAAGCTMRGLSLIHI